MKKQTFIIGIVSVLIVALILLLILFNNSDKGSIETSSDAINMLNKIFQDNSSVLPNSLETREIDVSNSEEVSSFTGLKSNSDVEFLVIGEPMMSSQAFSSVVVGVKDGANIESMKQEMLDNINTSKWLCVTAEKLYIANNGNIIFLVMADENWANTVFNGFKKHVNNNTGKILEKNSSEDIVLPEIVE